MMYRAHEGGEVRRFARDRGMTSAVPPKAKRKNKWDHDRKLFKFAIWPGFACLMMQSSKLVLSASKREIPCLKGLHMDNLQAKQPPAFSMRSPER